MNRLKFIEQPGVSGPCCPPDAKGRDLPFMDGYIQMAAMRVPRVKTTISRAERWEHVKCRTSAYRNSYTVLPGLYAVGDPDEGSEVMVSANYKLSFDHLRRELAGMNAWILVLDTRGINVWCAAGKRTFGTTELISRIRSTGIEGFLLNKRVILPQLGAVGVSAGEVRKATGLRVYYGPVRAADIKQYLASGMKATEEMRTIGFGMLDRLILTPMEIRPAMARFPLFAIAALIVMGLSPQGILFSPMWHTGMPILAMLLVAVVAGAFLTPLLLPYVPARAFSVKGYIVGLLAMLIIRLSGLMSGLHPLVIAAAWVWFPVLSSYIALQFTGATTFTGMSGVKRELRYCLPLYIGASVLAAGLVIVFKVVEWKGA